MDRSGTKPPEPVDPPSALRHVRRPTSTERRLVLPFSSNGCCDPGVGFFEREQQSIPHALAVRGVTAAQWSDALTRLHRQVQSKQLHQCGCICLVLTVVFIPCVCVTRAVYHTALRKWLRDLNRDVLEPRGMLGRLQTSNVVKVNEACCMYREEISWLAIALDADEVARLRREPIYWSPSCCDDDVVVPDPCRHAHCCCCVWSVV